MVLGGKITDPALFRERLAQAGLVLAADSGARHVLQAGAYPAEVYGDMDSLATDEMRSLVNNGCRLVASPAEKDDTDGALVLREALGRGFGDIRIWGALGGRPDHAYANMMLLQLALQPEYRQIYGKAEDDLPEAVIEDGGIRVFLAKRGQWIEGEAGEYLSLFALTPEVTGFTQEGLKYQPADGRFTSAFPLGVSNEFTGNRARLDWDEGILLCMQVNIRKKGREWT